MPSSTSLMPSLWPASTPEMLIFLRCMQMRPQVSGPETWVTSSFRVAHEQPRRAEFLRDRRTRHATDQLVSGGAGQNLKDACCGPFDAPTWMPSRSSIRILAAEPPGAENPPILPPAAKTL